LGEVEAFLRRHPHIPAYLVDVRAQRAVSQQIAARSGVEHESPQIIVFRRGAVVWNASHHDITVEALTRGFPAA
jgi:bacillithiol system protein YtxJ